MLVLLEDDLCKVKQHLATFPYYIEFVSWTYLTVLICKCNYVKFRKFLWINIDWLILIDWSMFTCLKLWVKCVLHMKLIFTVVWLKFNVSFSHFYGNIWDRQKRADGRQSQSLFNFKMYCRWIYTPIDSFAYDKPFDNPVRHHWYRSTPKQPAHALL